MTEKTPTFNRGKGTKVIKEFTMNIVILGDE